MTLTHYIGGKLTGDTADFDLPLSTNYPNLTTFINFETFVEYILVDGVWQQVGIPPVVGVGGWREIARTTLAVPSTTIDTPEFDDKRYYMILTSQINGDGSTPNWQYRIGSGGVVDVNSNYANRRQLDGVEQTGLVNQNRLVEYFSAQNRTRFGVTYAANLPTKEKLLQGHAVNQQTVGAGTPPTRAEWVGKHSQTSVPMDIFRLSGSQTYSTGSEIVVLGWDPDDSHTDGFWEELASVDLSGGVNSTLSTGVFTPKKYLWVQAYLDTQSGTADVWTRAGTGTVSAANNYSMRFSNDGAADGTQINMSRWDAFATTGGTPTFLNFFMLNVAGQEQIGIYHKNNQNTAGVGTVPARGEGDLKLSNIATQIDIIDFIKQSGQTLGTKSIVKVWGHD